MDGDFRSDITRDTYRRTKHFSRVIRQQGRPDIDADWNELVDILLHYQRTVTGDIIGPHAGPDMGFGIAARPDPQKADNDPDEKEEKEDSDRDERRKKRPKKSGPPPQQDSGAYEFLVQEGRYYVDGILCECDRDRYIYTMPVELRNQKQPQYLFYLDVWEREVTAYEDDSIREVALGGPDSATRSVVVWRIRVLPDPLTIAGTLLQGQTQYARMLSLNNYTDKSPDNWHELSEDWTYFVRHFAPDFSNTPHAGAKLKARAEVSTQDNTDPCITPPSSQYRGAENQLYRVEIHRGGAAYQQNGSGNQPGTGKSEGRGTDNYDTSATFTWSRENGSVVFPITGPVSGGSTITVTVNDLGRDDSRFALQTDDWVEIVDVEEVLEIEPGPLLQVSSIDYGAMQVTLKAYNNTPVTFDNDDAGQTRSRVLRRWDYQRGDPSQKGAIELARDGAAKLVENTWITLEDGIQILFHSDFDADSDADDKAGPVQYHTGDYWQIPARTASGDIDWPHSKHAHEALPSHGVRHHFAPLAFVTLDKTGKFDPSQSYDLRRKIKESWEPVIP